MARRGDYKSFFGSRYSRRGDFVFVAGKRRYLRWILPHVLIAAAVPAVMLLFINGKNGGAGGPDESTIPTLLVAQTTSTTSAASITSVQCPQTSTDPTSAMFQGTPERTGCFNAPTISEPTILWNAEVGLQGWLNNPVVSNGVVYVGSAGSLQFEGDRRDGVYALDLATGEELWFYRANNDVNGVAASGDLVVATGDEHAVWGIDISSGRPVWSALLEASVFGNPLIIDDLAYVGDASGTLTALNMSTGQTQWRASVAGDIRGGPASDGERIYVAGEDLEVLAITLDGQEVWRNNVVGSPGARTTIFAPPTIAGDLVIISLVRDAVFADPGLVALDKNTGEVVWQASDAAGVKTEWGSVRSSPAVVGDLLIYGDTYSSRLIAIDATNGETLWSTEVGVFCYRHWSSPIVVSGQAILPRYDGGVYSVDLASQTRLWDIYIGDRNLRGNFPLSYNPEFCMWELEEGSPVLASPIVADNGTILVGTLEGYLFAIGDESWE
jgi:outer membrane protein assembly factor BamB